MKKRNMLPQKAIIHTVSRIIRRITVNTNPIISSDETAIDLPAHIDIGNGPWKLDTQNQKQVLTAQEKITFATVRQQ